MGDFDPPELKIVIVSTTQPRKTPDVLTSRYFFLKNKRSGTPVKSNFSLILFSRNRT